MALCVPVEIVEFVSVAACFGIGTDFYGITKSQNIPVCHDVVLSVSTSEGNLYNSGTRCHVCLIFRRVFGPLYLRMISGTVFGYSVPYSTTVKIIRHHEDTVRHR